MAESDLGLGAKGQVGQEWWMGANWALGLAAQVAVGVMNDKSNGLTTPRTWTATSASLLFSSTYN